MGSNRFGVKEVWGKIRRASTQLTLEPISPSQAVEPFHCILLRGPVSTPNRRQIVRCRTRLTPKQDQMTSCLAEHGPVDPIRFVTFVILSQCSSVGPGSPVKPDQANRLPRPPNLIVRPDHLNYTEHTGTRALPRFR